MGNSSIRYIRKVEKALKEKNTYLEQTTWKKLFQEYDKKRDGYLTKHSLRRFVQDVFKTFPTDPPATEEEIIHTAGCFLSVLDQNGDGKISLREFISGIHDVFIQFHIEQRNVDEIKTEYEMRAEEERKRQEEQKKFDDEMYPLFKERTERMRTEKSVEAVSNFLCNSKWTGSLISEKQLPYVLAITSVSLEEGTFHGYHVIGNIKESITGEFLLKFEWMYVMISYKDEVNVHEAKFSLREEVPK